MQTRQFHALVAGVRLVGDWFPGRIPENIEAGANTVVDSSFCFKHFFAAGAVGLRVGSDVTFWRTSIAPERHGVIEIGDRCSIGNASLVCVQRITIGADVMIAGGVTITDSDFHVDRVRHGGHARAHDWARRHCRMQERRDARPASVRRCAGESRAHSSLPRA